MPIIHRKIEGTPLILLPEHEFKRLLDDAMEPCHLEGRTLTCPDTRNVVLTSDAWDELQDQQPDEDWLFCLDMPKKGVFAKAVVYDDGTNVGISVLRGSTVGEPVPSMPDVYRKKRQGLIDIGVIKASAFSSACQLENPSEAACILTGDSKSGNEMWRDRRGRTLGERNLAATQRRRLRLA